jgi:hypothetical protein
MTTRAPDRLFRRAELGELACAQRGFVGAEELVELRRRDARAGEHRVRLAAMVDLVLEQMREEPRDGLRLHAHAAHDGDGLLELVVGEA